MSICTASVVSTPATILGESRWPDASAALAYLEQLAIAGGPSMDDRESFHAWLLRCQQLVDAGRLDAAQLRAVADAHGILSVDTLQGRAFRKPRGYAGDFEMIDRLYLSEVCSDPRLARWDAAWQTAGAARAVRNRKAYFLALLDHALARHVDVDTLHVLDVASGPARDVAEHLVAHPDTRCHFTCLDLDADAIAHAQTLVGGTGAGDRVGFVNANALRWRAAQQFHLVWSAGLFDYLPDRMFVRLLARLWQSVLPGGELVVGNFDPANPSRPFMELLGDWQLLHRSREQLRALALEAGLPADAITIGAEELGINLFLHVRRAAADAEHIAA